MQEDNKERINVLCVYLCFVLQFVFHLDNKAFARLVDTGTFQISFDSVLHL